MSAARFVAYWMQCNVWSTEKKYMERWATKLIVQNTHPMFVLFVLFVLANYPMQKIRIRKKDKSTRASATGSACATCNKHWVSFCAFIRTFRFLCVGTIRKYLEIDVHKYKINNKKKYTVSMECEEGDEERIT